MPPATPSESFDTPTIPSSEAVFVVQSTTRIAAPASLVFRTLRNTETWRDWNPWVPKVVITFQTPDPDTATAEEIAELVRNTSIAGSYDSDLTDGIVGKKPRRVSADSEKPPDTPPLKLRSKSNASVVSGSGPVRNNSEVSTNPPQLAPASPKANSNGGNNNNNNNNNNSNGDGGGAKLSAAQKYAAAQESRRSSIKSGETLPAVSENVLVYDPFLSPSSATPTGSNINDNDQPRRKSVATAVEKARQKANQQLLLQMYGEPSVRIQLDTKMTFWVRMNPREKFDYKQLHVVVTHVSRPDDPSTDGNDITPLTRSKTHTLSDSPKDGTQPVYRIVWTIDASKSSLSAIKNGSAFPKSLLAAERVHEIRPIVLGNGDEECEYRSWECQKGPLAKLAKKKHAGYIQTMFERWGAGLGQFCEGLGGKVDRRDFSVDLPGIVIEEEILQQHQQQQQQA